MRTVELTRVAVASEGLRLRRFAVFIVLERWLGPIPSVLIVLALDVIGAGVLGAMALSSKPDAVEQEAREVRAQALIELRRSMTTMALAAEVGGALLRRRARTGVRNGVATGVAHFVSRLIGR